VDQTHRHGDWLIALRFYPDLKDLEDRLTKIDPSLIGEFRDSLLDSKRYEQRKSIACQIEQNYLEKFFGTDPLVIEFARDLLVAGRRDGAKELNRSIKVVGQSLSAEKIIEKLEAQYLPNRPKKQTPIVVQDKSKQSTFLSGTSFLWVVTIAVISIGYVMLKPTHEQSQLNIQTHDPEIGKWVASIQHKIRNNWTKPSNEMSICEVYIQQSREGVIHHIIIKACEGTPSEAYKESIKSAIRNASPLPRAPSDADFRSEMIIIFKPE
jgi:hypothetical protein